MQERNQSLDAGKGFAMILVMLGHCIVLNGLQDGYLYDAIKAIQMPFFMIISGYIAAFSGKIENGTELRVLIQKRAVAYLLPFFMWIIVLHPMSIVTSTIEILFQLDKGLWFLITLFLLTAVMYLAVFAGNRTKWPLLGFAVVWLLFCVLLLFQTITGNQFLSPHLTIYHLPFYLGGFLLNKGKKYFELSFFQSKAVRFILTAFAAFAFVYIIAGFDMIAAHNKIELLVQLLAGFLGCFLCFRFVSTMHSGKIKNALSYIGKYTLEIYVLHFHFATVLGLAEKNITLWSIRGGFWLLASFIIMSIATAISIIALRRFKLTKLLLFGKQTSKK